MEGTNAGITSMYSSERPTRSVELGAVRVRVGMVNSWIIGRAMNSSGSTVIVPITKRLRR